MTSPRKFARKLQRGFARAGAYLGPHGVILMYHRIAQPDADPWKMSVSRENFAAHLEIIRNFGTPTTMGDMGRGFREKWTSDRAIAVTFDDGYVDNLHAALPLMEQYDVPGTLFVVSGAVGRSDAFWWDMLTRVFLQTPNLPRQLVVNAGKNEHGFDLGAACDCDEEEMHRHATWDANEIAPQDDRQRAFLDVWTLMVCLPPNEQADVATQIQDWAGDDGARATPQDGRPMDAEELSRMAASPLLEIGGHTVTHPDLSRMDAASALQELSKGRHDLIELTGKAVDSFAYPYGRMSRDTPRLIEAAGFNFAACSRTGLATGWSHPRRLPRVHVPNMQPAEFESLLRHMLGRPRAQWRA